MEWNNREGEKIIISGDEDTHESDIIIFLTTLTEEEKMSGTVPPHSLQQPAIALQQSGHEETEIQEPMDTEMIYPRSEKKRKVALLKEVVAKKSKITLNVINNYLEEIVEYLDNPESFDHMTPTLHSFNNAPSK